MEWVNKWMNVISWEMKFYKVNNFTLNILQNATGWHTKYCNLTIILILSYKRLNVIDAVASTGENKTSCFRNDPHNLCQLFIILSSFYFILSPHFFNVYKHVICSWGTSLKHQTVQGDNFGFSLRIFVKPQR